MKKRKYTPAHNYTEEQKQFIRDNITGRSYQEMTDLFNTAFGTAFEAGRMKGAIARLGVNNGRDGRFHSEQVPWNTGRKGVRYSPATEFKKGNTPVNHRPCGSERVSVDGYVEIKVAEPNRWRLKHRVVWEQAHGPAPAGHVVIFADGNRQNTDLENLILVTRGELAVLNKSGLVIGGSREITEASIQVARLKMAMHDRNRMIRRDQ